MKKLHLLTDKQLSALISEELEARRKENEKALQTELLSRQLSLRSLQSQINPHFLYNALESVRGRAIMDGAPVVADMVHALSRFFRYSISQREDIVSLGDELANIQNYLKIQRFRFGERFLVEIDGAQGDAMGVQLPKLTLQPIVENAFAHGLESMAESGCLRVSVQETTSHVIVIVSDNGAGMNKETLEKLRHRIGQRTTGSLGASEGAGVALVNVDQRLKLTFGESYGLHITSVEGFGTDVMFRIPRRSAAT